jgi:spore germination protein
MKKLFTIAFMFALFGAHTADAGKTENIFYYYPNQNGYESVKKNYRNIDILAPQIYTVGYDLTLGEAESEDILELADKKRIDVMPLVVQTGFDKILMTRLLDDEDAQDDLIDDLVDEAKDRDFIGWQFDFENINYLDRDRYTDFVEKAYIEFKEKKLKFSVAVIPRTTTFNPYAGSQDWSSGYNIAAIAAVSDFVSIMSYDDPRSIGPVSSLQYLDAVLAETLKDTPAEKISLGVPFYCWQYEIGNGGKIASVTYEISKNTQEKYEDNGVFSLYLDSLGAEIFAFVKDTGRVNYIWCDNRESVETKNNIVKDKGLRGMSFWALGQEDPDIWKDL